MILDECDKLDQILQDAIQASDQRLKLFNKNKEALHSNDRTKPTHD